MVLLSINSIYLDRNFNRDASSIFTHLVEIVGSLSLLATEKTKPAVDPERYIPKALAWWMALCGKVGVRSVEDMLWGKISRGLQLLPHESCTSNCTVSRGSALRRVHTWATASRVGTTECFSSS